MHACDIGNPCLEYKNYHNWASLITQEFNDETVKEEEHNLTVTGFKKFTNKLGYLKGQCYFAGKIMILLVY